jgi:hypothetical protein
MGRFHAAGPDAAKDEDGGAKAPAAAAPSFSVRVAADLGEFALFVSGRPADVWWPDEVSPASPPSWAVLLAVLPMSKPHSSRHACVHAWWGQSVNEANVG